MTAPNLDAQGRRRSKTVAFRMSPEENRLLDRMVAASGLTKQDYITSRLLQRSVVVVPSTRMQRYLEDNMLVCCQELHRIQDGGTLPPDLAELVAYLGEIFAGLGREQESAAEREASAIAGMERS